MSLRWALVAIMLASSCATSEDVADQSFDRVDLLLRSDLPLWLDYQDQSISPRSFQDETGFGCLSEWQMGDWKLTYTAKNAWYTPTPIWWRVNMHGIIHCGASFQQGSDRGGNAGGVRAGFMVKLGVDAATGLELWAWEIGVRPGSEYMLLATSGDEKQKRFRVLDTDCNGGEIRRADPTLSTWRTDYCNVPTQDVMRSIAKAAAARPPLGELVFMGETPANER